MTNDNLRWLRTGVATLVAAFAAGLAPAQEGTEVSNNLSFPAVLTGGTVTLPGVEGAWTLGGAYPAAMSYGCGTPETVGQFSFPNTSCVALDGAPLSYAECVAVCGTVPVERIYWQKQAANAWQAAHLDDQGTQVAQFVPWGDSLRSRTWSVSSMVRVETTPYTTLPEPQVGFHMWHVFGHGSNEMWGVRATDNPDPATPGEPYGYATNYAIVRSPSARLNFAKLGPDAEACGGATPYAGAFAWNALADNKWGALQMNDIPLVPELNIGGKFVYGHTWQLGSVTMPAGAHKAGWWRLTFYAPDVQFEATTSIIAPPLPDSAPMAQPDPAYPEEIALYTPVVDAVNHITYIDICLSASGGGGGGGSTPTLEVAKSGGGSGTVASLPAGIDCGATCSAQFAAGTVVTLTATPDLGSVFSGWTDCAAPAGNQCVVTMAEHVHVSLGAAFGRAPTGDFNADVRSDILWSHADGRAAIWLMDGAGATGGGEIIAGGTGWSVAGVADFDADGKADLLWSHPDGRAAVWLMNGHAATGMAQILDAGTGWSVAQAGDLDGNGKADIVWRHADGGAAAWLMDGLSMTGGAGILSAGTGWSPARVADFDGDDKGDILWVHADGGVAISLMNGAAPTGTAQILNAATGWSVAHVRDFDGNGTADIAWQHADGSLAVWLMNGASMAGGAQVLGPGTGWSAARAGDFDGDGKADFLFGHADGRAAIWLMDGSTPVGMAQILNAGGGWSARHLADFNGDGRDDIVWENADGRVAVWLMNGTAMTGGGEILGPASGWSVDAAMR